MSLVTPESLPSIAETIKKYELWQKKSLGQHFLHHPQLIDKIAKAAGRLEGHTVIEIGPGPGGLTRALLANGADQVVAVEKDSRSVGALQELVQASNGRLTVMEADALQVRLDEIGSAPRKVVANLPYNISTVLLLAWLPQSLVQLTLMFQKEVAQRLWAMPGDNHYGRLSVITQFYCSVHKAFDIAPEAFIPPPKVMSTVVNLVPHAAPVADIPVAWLEKVTAAAFGQRRKMLRSSIKSIGGETLLEQAGITPTARAEELSVADFCRLATAYGKGA